MLAKSSYVSMIVFAAALIGLSTHAICAFLITGRSLNTDGSMQCEKVISISRIANLVLICGTLIVLCILLLNSIFLSKAHSADSSKSQRFIIRAVTIINIMIATFYHLAWISSFVFWIWSFFMFKADTDEQCQSLNNQSLQTMTTFRCMWSPDSCNKRDVYKFYQILLIMCAASSALMFFSSIFYLIFGGSLFSRWTTNRQPKLEITSNPMESTRSIPIVERSLPGNPDSPQPMQHPSIKANTDF